MAANYVLLEKITVGAAGASSVTFSGIPQTGYTDVVVKSSSRADSNVVAVICSINASALDSGQRLRGNGTGVSEVSSAENFGVNPSAATANTFSNAEWYFPNYTSSNYKSVSMDGVTENNATEAYTSLTAGLENTTSAITSLSFAPSGANFVQYSTFYLYGVAALGTTPAIVPYATGGDTIMTDGTYWYHAFKASGTFTPATGKSLSCDYLVVAGGGGGSGGYGAGGGAGGYRSTTAQTVASATTITIGAGGAGGFSANNVGVDGNNSSAGAFASTAGGGAGIYQPPTGVAKPGGSGGGAGGGDTAGGTGGAGNLGSYSPVEGYAGGNGRTAGGAPSGGGGGAGGVGANFVSASQSGAGGAGSNSHSSWLSVVGLGVSGYLAGGGGGGGHIPAGVTAGTGGSGGGGAGSTGSVGTSGTANTGSGGGGGGLTVSITNSGGAGGSGLVVVRYAV